LFAYTAFAADDSAYEILWISLNKDEA